MPRRLTNETNLPLPIYTAIKNDSYIPRGDISVTTLIDSPWIRLLRKYNEYEEDASDMLWAMEGQIVHSMLERAALNLDNEVWKPEFKMQIKIGDKILSGTADLLEKSIENILHDYKRIFVWAARLGKESPNYKHWLLQTNIYKIMLKYGKHFSEDKVSDEKIGLDISKIYIHSSIRDWKKSESKRIENYPKTASVTFEINILPEAEVIVYIRERMKLHFESEKKYLAGEVIDHCTEEERWTRPEIWRITKIGGKRAINGGVFTIKTEADKKQALEFYTSNVEKYKGLLKIDKTEGTDIRCEDYCSVCQFCSYYKSKYNEYGERRRATDDGAEAVAVSRDTEGAELQGVDFF